MLLISELVGVTTNYVGLIAKVASCICYAVKSMAHIYAAERRERNCTIFEIKMNRTLVPFIECSVMLGGQQRELWGAN